MCLEFTKIIKNSANVSIGKFKKTFLSNDEFKISNKSTSIERLKGEVNKLLNFASTTKISDTSEIDERLKGLRDQIKKIKNI